MAEPATEEKAFGRCQNDVLLWSNQKKRAFTSKPHVAVVVFIFYILNINGIFVRNLSY